MMSELISNVMSPDAPSQSAGPGGSPTTPASPVYLAARLDSLENKTVYLVDNGFGGGPQFMRQLQKWFALHMPAVTTELRRKTGHVFQDDTTDLWDEIKARGHAVVYGVAG